MSESISSGSAGQSADLRTRIAAVVAAHRIEPLYLAFRCSCLPDAWLASRSDCDLHLADAVIRELGLQRLEAGKWADGLSGHRYITEWIADE